MLTVKIRLKPEQVADTLCHVLLKYRNMELEEMIEELGE